jgi:hypothetical protein
MHQHVKYIAVFKHSGLQTTQHFAARSGVLLLERV